MHKANEGKTNAAFAGIAILLTLLVLFAVFCADNTSDKLGAWLFFFTGGQTSPSLLAGVGMALAAVLMVFFFTARRFLMGYRGGLRLGGFSAAGASIKLEEGSHSYFDQYLDEIVYFFEANDYDTVVFEDIDRFDDPYIFEELKELNNTLNKASGIGKRIHFVYALRDSLFELDNLERSGEHSASESLDAGVRGSGRVKFFDAIIPVVPFLSELNAFDYMFSIFDEDIAEISAGQGTSEETKKKLEGDKENFGSCLRTTASFVADMRLIKEIHNEYVVMIDEMGPCTPRGESLGLSYSGILGMAVYKNVYPGDFEKMRTGASWLNAAYSVFTASIERNLAELRERKDWYEHSELAGRTVAERCVALGDELRSLLDGFANGEAYAVKVEDTSYQPDVLSTPKFWEVFAKLPDEGDLEFMLTRYGTLLDIKKSQVFSLCSPNFSRDVSLLWSDEDASGVLALNTEISRLMGADFSDCLDLECVVENADRDSTSPSNSVSFKDYVVDNSVGDLATALVLGGHLGKNFRLYASLYPQERRAAVINFMGNHFYTNAMSLDFRLDDDDCVELLQRIDLASLLEPRCFNVDLLRYCSRHRRDAARLMVRGACRNYTTGGRALLLDYFQTAEKGDWLNEAVLGTLAKEGSFTFAFIVEGPIGEDDIPEALMLALSTMGPADEYDMKSLSTWMAAHGASLDFSRLNLDEKQAKVVCDLFAACGFEPSTLDGFEGLLRQELIRRGMYPVTRFNVCNALADGDALPPLDRIAEAFDGVFARITRDEESLLAYVQALRAGEPSLESYETPALLAIADCSGGDAFVRVLSKSDLKRMNDMHSIVSVFEENNRGAAAPEFVDACAEEGLITPIIANVLEIMRVEQKDNGGEDLDALRLLLSDDAVFEEDESSEEDPDMEALVMRVLRSDYLDDQTVAKLAGRLVALRPNSFPVSAQVCWQGDKRGSDVLFSLFEEGVLGDVDKVYQLLEDGDWQLREKCLFEKQKNGAVPALDFPFADDIPRIIESTLLEGGKFQRFFVGNASKALAAKDADAKCYAATAIALADKGIDVTPDVIRPIVSGQIDDSCVLEITESHLPMNTKLEVLAGHADSMRPDSLADALKNLGDGYSKIVDFSSRQSSIERNADNEVIAKAAKQSLAIVSKVKLQDKKIVVYKHTKRLKR